jgi:hypothetical protein
MPRQVFIPVKNVLSGAFLISGWVLFIIIVGPFISGNGKKAMPATQAMPGGILPFEGQRNAEGAAGAINPGMKAVGEIELVYALLFILVVSAALFFALRIVSSRRERRQGSEPISIVIPKADTLE